MLMQDLMANGNHAKSNAERKSSAHMEIMLITPSSQGKDVKESSKRASGILLKDRKRAKEGKAALNSIGKV